jgi:RNase P protein component
VAGVPSSPRAAPRAANVSPSESSPLTAPASPTAVAARFGLPPARRLHSPAQFAAVAGRDGRSAGTTWRGSRHFLAMQARIVAMADVATQSPRPAAAPVERVRFGFTVGKRNARRAVERALVKRVLREAARHAAPALDAAAGPRAVDVLLRLKAVCPPKTQLPRPRFRHALRAEADALLAGLTQALRVAAAGGESA